MKSLEQGFRNKLDAEKKADARYQRGQLLTHQEKYKAAVDNMTAKAMVSMYANPAEAIAWRQIMGLPATEDNIRFYLTNKIGRRAQLEGKLK